MTRYLTAVLLLAGLARAADTDETVRYLRLLPGGKTTEECTFTVRSNDQAKSVRSVTKRGDLRMTVSAAYDPQDQLTAADAALSTGKNVSAVFTDAKNGKARVKRPNVEVQEFDVPARLIVTSAPDWSDTFLLCRYYDRQKGGKQEFPGLWIHPEQPAQRLTFSIERTGNDTIEHEGKKLTLDRHLIRIRNNSAYAAWTDASGRMIKLTSLPVKEQGGAELVLAGYEKSAADLKPPRP